MFFQKPRKENQLQQYLNVQQMIPLSSSREGGLLVLICGWQTRHSPTFSLVQHAGVGYFCCCWCCAWCSIVWYFFTISFTCELKSTSSSYGALRHTFGVVGASGKSEMDDDFSRTIFVPADVVLILLLLWCWIVITEVDVFDVIIVVVGSFSPFSGAFNVFSLLLSSSSANDDVTHDDLQLITSIVSWSVADVGGCVMMVTFDDCTVRICCGCWCCDGDDIVAVIFVVVSDASHLWFKHSLTSRRSLKLNKREIMQEICVKKKKKLHNKANAYFSSSDRNHHAFWC